MKHINRLNINEKIKKKLKSIDMRNKNVNNEKYNINYNIDIIFK
jgi:hypothetical protein